MIAALYVAPNGSYINVPGVDPWPEDRDARLYAGPHPVVAHPPCQRWGKFWAGQPLFIKQTGIRKIKGDDKGCFSAALNAVRTYGGVLEHPCDSHAWAHFGLNKPPRKGGWIFADYYGWTCCVEQGRYGHYARKPTWLYAVGITLPELDWVSAKQSWIPRSSNGWVSSVPSALGRSVVAAAARTARPGLGRRFHSANFFCRSHALPGRHLRRQQND